MSTAIAPPSARALTAYKPFWAKRFGPAPFLPTSRAEMELLGWDSCDVIIVTGDAYVDHPSFGMAVIGRTLEAQGFRVGIVAQPDWSSADAFKALGAPNLFFGVTAGNMDSMINRYTADRKIRSDDAYTPGGQGGARPDRCSLVYVQRCKEAFGDVPIVLGGIEASLRRIAHYDYWQDKVRRSMLVDSKADLLLYGNAERAVIEIAHRLARREPVHSITDVRGTVFVRRRDDATAGDWFELDSSEVDLPGRLDEHINPYQSTSEQAAAMGTSCAKEQAAGDPLSPRRTPGSTALGEEWIPAFAGMTEGDSARGLAVVAMPVSRKTGKLEPAAARTDRDPPSVLRTGEERRRALRPREPRPAPGDEPRQRTRPRAAPRQRRRPRATSGSTRRRSRSRRPRWTMCSTCRTRAARTRCMRIRTAAMTGRRRSRRGK